jgi:ferredoxin
MKQNVVFYFSGTGNSLKVARDIADEISDCEVASMSRAASLSGTYERIGFVFPCYSQGIPNIVTRFISALDLSMHKDAYYFVVVTCGASPGNCLAQVKSLLENKGLQVQYGSVVKMFANYVALYKMANNPTERAAESSIAVKQVCAEINRRVQNKIPRSNFVLSLLYNIMSSSYAVKSKGFRVSDACNGCKNCANICPVDNITMKGDKPIFDSKCEQCMACIQWCPKKAIDYKKKTQTRGRYHHPDISFRDMLVQQQNEDSKAT